MSKTTTDLSTLKINYLSQEAYDAEKSSGTIEENEIYLTPSLLAPYRIGQIIAYAGSNEPLGWLKCDGRAVSRTTYSALFSVIGTTYGSGDGSTTFNIPDFRNRFPVGAGDTYSLNDKGGNNTVTLNVNQIPNHNHNVGLNTGGSSYGSGLSYATNSTYRSYADTGEMIGKTGGGQAHENRPPYIGINYLIYVGGDAPATSVYIETLWTNSSPGSSFAAQDITLNGAYDAYSYIEVEYKSTATQDNDTGMKMLDRSPCHSQSVASIVVYTTQWELMHRARWWNSDHTAIHFDSSYTNILGASTSGQYDSNLVPYKIYGIK